MHRILAVVLALLFGSTALRAEEIKGKVKEVNVEKNTITLTVGAKEQKVAVDPEAIFVIDNNKAQTFRGGLKALKPEMEVTLVTARKEDKQVAGLVKVKLPPKQ